ncbi:MAG TPA: serine hydrolase [Stellaceae bacterium]|nr:serine hydrolase [Stellaceae bacterium]
MTRLMHGFPPSADAQVTLANWRQAPFSRWAFQHVRELVQSAEVANDPSDVHEWPIDRVEIGDLPIEADEAPPLSFDDFLADTSTDGIVVVSGGRIVFERYANGMTETTPHILMSVSKSLLGLIAGVLAASGRLEPDRQVTDFVPEVGGTAYEGATIRHLLDMRTGVAFDEDYLATSGAIIAYRKATNWIPLDPGEAPSDLRSFYRAMTERDGPHGGRFHYVSPNSDLLGWAIERATGRRYADLISELIWRPMGAARSAYITVDRLGAPRAAGGVCATLRDLALVGQLMTNGGVRGGKPVLPRAWLDDIAANGDPQAWAAGEFALDLPGGRYRSQWYVAGGDEPLLFGLGIHGQYLFVDAERQLVIAKVSSHELPLDAARSASTLRAVSAVRRALAG